MEKEMAAPMFQGFSQQTNDFLWGIRFNNERSWFEAHKQTYLDQVQAPLRELAQEVYQQFSARHQDLPLMVRVSRIYRDARRLFGRGPYKSHLWFSLRIAGEDWAAHPVLWFEIFPAGYAYGMGIYDAKPATMARFRQDMDQHPQKMGSWPGPFRSRTASTWKGRSTSAPRATPSRPWTSGTTGRTWTCSASGRSIPSSTALTWWGRWWGPLRNCCPTTAISPTCAAGATERVDKRVPLPFPKRVCKATRTGLF